MNSKSDNIYAKPQPHIVDFVFDASVASVFPDMIRRSVPGYDNIITMIGLFAEQFVQNKSQCYDLGCSLGAATLAMRQHIQQPDSKIIAVDNAEAMVAQCRAHLENDNTAVPVEIRCANIQDIIISNASFVVMNFILQFIDPEQRTELIKNIANGMLPGSALVLSEKINFADPYIAQQQQTLHEAFKKANGYSELEISQKRNALENVLVPDTLEQHQQRLKSAGFKTSTVWFQCFNFASLIAIK